MHYCLAVGCALSCDPARLMCAAHWRRVPELQRRDVARYWTPGQVAEVGAGSVRWDLAAARAVWTLAVLERKASREEAVEAYLALEARLRREACGEPVPHAAAWVAMMMGAAS